MLPVWAPGSFTAYACFYPVWKSKFYGVSAVLFEARRGQRDKNQELSHYYARAVRKSPIEVLLSALGQTECLASAAVACIPPVKIALHTIETDGACSLAYGRFLVGCLTLINCFVCPRVEIPPRPASAGRPIVRVAVPSAAVERRDPLATRTGPRRRAYLSSRLAPASRARERATATASRKRT